MGRGACRSGTEKRPADTSSSRQISKVRSSAGLGALLGALLTIGRGCGAKPQPEATGKVAGVGESAARGNVADGHVIEAAVLQHLPGAIQAHGHELSPERR